MNKLVTVTGAEGFIGSHLVEALVRSGVRVRAMVLYNSFNSWGWLDQLPPDVLENVEVVMGDVRDPVSVRECMRDAEVVYHLAALIAIPYSYQAPHSYVQTNVVGTLNVLEAARDLHTPRIIHTSTSEVYGTARQVPIHETHPLQAQSPYAASKVGADKLAESYSPQLRPAGGHAAALQYLRPPAVGPRRHSHHHQPDRGPRPGGQGRLVWPPPATSITCPTRPIPSWRWATHRPPTWWAAPSIPAPGSRSRWEN